MYKINLKQYLSNIILRKSLDYNRYNNKNKPENLFKVSESVWFETSQYLNWILVKFTGIIWVCMAEICRPVYKYGIISVHASTCKISENLTKTYPRMMTDILWAARLVL